MKKVRFIINPISGTENKDYLIKEIISELKDKNIDFKISFSRDEKDAEKLTKKAVKDKYDIVIAAGGDGTINKIASNLVKTKTVLGIIPLGSGNGLARHLGISLDSLEAIRLIECGKIISADYGLIENIPFFCTCGVGFDARIGALFARQETRGFRTYLKTTLREFRNYKPQKYKIIIDENSIKRNAFLITVANASQYGNNAYIAPLANMEDGELDISILKPFPSIIAPTLGIKLFRKKIHTSPYVEVFSGKQIVIKRKHKGEIHIDGEPFLMGKKLKIEVVKGGLKILVPNKA